MGIALKGAKMIKDFILLEAETGKSSFAHSSRDNEDSDMP